MPDPGISDVLGAHVVARDGAVCGKVRSLTRTSSKRIIQPSPFSEGSKSKEVMFQHCLACIHKVSLGYIVARQPPYQVAQAFTKASNIIFAESVSLGHRLFEDVVKISSPHLLPMNGISNRGRLRNMRRKSSMVNPHFNLPTLGRFVIATNGGFVVPLAFIQLAFVHFSNDIVDASSSRQILAIQHLLFPYKSTII
jgi:hypothetical protein